ncbi:hypothetical protein BCR42DRAFT_446531 [Absidia repens]|uniref:Uncharacterized protein n=1 Tax=Absidia repens TaxID=90262 RepID=A0A1X2IZ91_9FUNG|nr:hypothetical protein BCR42DRAFT_446531 [Absidia repens]
MAEPSYQFPQVTVKYINWLIEQAPSESQEWISKLRQVIHQQQKELRVYFLTVDALEEQYQQERQSYDQLSRRLKQELSEHDALAQEQEQQHKHDGQLLDFLEQQLVYWRTHATQRRDKKAKREQQYHQAYFFPVVNSHYQKKYIEARDKNNQVEQQVSDLHHAMDSVKIRLKQHRQAMAAGLKYRHALVERQQQLEVDKNDLQQLMVEMKQAQSFWCQFDIQHIQPYLGLLLHVDQEYNANDSSSFSDDRWTRIRQSTMDYEQAQKHGLLQHWNPHRSRNIHFMCTQCHEINNYWPSLEKQTTQLLCKPCYHYMNAQRSVKEATTPTPNSDIQSQPLSSPQPKSQKKPLLSTLSSSSSVFMPSLFTSTTKSAHILMNDCKPFVKKMKSALALNYKLDLLAHHPLLVSRYLYRSLLS